MQPNQTVPQVLADLSLRHRTAPRMACRGTGRAGLRTGPPTWRTGSGIRNRQQLRMRRTAACRLILWPTETYRGLVLWSWLLRAWDGEGELRVLGRPLWLGDLQHPWAPSCRLPWDRVGSTDTRGNQGAEHAQAGQSSGEGGARVGVWRARVWRTRVHGARGPLLTHHAQHGPGASRQRERVSSSLQQAYLRNRESSEEHLFLVESWFVFTTRAAEQLRGEAGRGEAGPALRTRCGPGDAER